MALSKDEINLLARVSSAMMDVMGFANSVYHQATILAIYSNLEPWQRSEMNQVIAASKEQQEKCLETMRDLVARIGELRGAE